MNNEPSTQYGRRRIERVTFVLPSSFQPADLLPGALAMRSDDARWFVSLVLKKTAAKCVDEWGLVRLHSDVLRRVMDQRNSAAVIRALVDGNVIEEAPHCAGVKAKGYRLANRFLGDRCVRVPAMDPRLIERLERERDRLDEEQPQSEWLPIHHDLEREQHHVTIAPEAEQLVDTLPTHTRLCQDVLVSNLRHRSLPFTVSRTGRVFNSITGLKRELRRTLRIERRPVGSVDIVCAQPGLLALMLSRQFHPSGVPKPRTTYKLTDSVCSSTGPLPADTARFVNRVGDGSFYQVLVDKTGFDRETVKLGFLRDVLAKKGRYPSAVESAFAAEFPTVHAAIREINAADHGELIRRLQGMESWLVVELVAPRLLSAGCHAVTLHDAIFARADKVSDVEAAFREVFDELDFHLSLKREAA